MISIQKNGAVAEIAELGAEMRSYRTKEGKDCLWSGDAAVWGGVAPLLFPVIGCLKNQSVRIRGKAYAVPRHGFARTMAFQVAQQSEESCTLTLTDTPETRAVYPFAFCLTMTHRMLDNGFSTEYQVENKSDETMPFVIGGHPGFACPMNAGERFEDYHILFDQEETGRSLLYGEGSLMAGEEIVALGADHRTLALSYDSFDKKDTLTFAGLASRKVRLVHKDTGKGICFSFPNSPVLAIWTQPGTHAPYLCLEPWNGIPGAIDETGNFEDKPYHIALAPGERFSAGYSMELLD